MVDENQAPEIVQGILYADLVSAKSFPWGYLREVNWQIQVSW